MPVFVDIGGQGKDNYAGVLQNRNVRTVFEGALLRNFLRKYKFLDGLLDMFKNKLVGIFFYFM